MKVLNLFKSPKFDSRIEAANVTGKEKWLGYFLGPIGALTFNQIVVTYLNIYYTDVIGATAWLGGVFLVAFPLISKIIDAITNLIMAALIEKTNTRQGKLRPWMLLSAPLMAISGIMLYCIPQMGQMGQMIWIVISYNLYYSVSFTMYTISQQMLVATSTRDVDQRTQVGIISSVSSYGVAGMTIMMIFPVAIYPIMQKNEAMWLPIMSIFSLIMLPLTIIQYFYTRERITEENFQTTKISESVPILKQLKGLATDKYYVFFMLFFVLSKFLNPLQNSSILYFCNWTLADTYTNGGQVAALVLIAGGIPSMFGMFLIWPLAKKFGKRNVALVGLLISVGGNLIGTIGSSSLALVALGKCIQTIGDIPMAYLPLAMLADTLDYAEWKNGFRSDGLSGAIVTIIITVTQGLATAVINGVLAAVDYQTPSSLLLADGTYGAQTMLVQNTFVWLAFGVGIIIYFLEAVLIWNVKAEKQMPKITVELMARKKAEAEANGEVWIDPIEAAQKEREELKQKRYERELVKLEEKCRKNGKKFDDEKAKYIAKKGRKGK